MAVHSARAGAETAKGSQDDRSRVGDVCPAGVTLHKRLPLSIALSHLRALFGT